MRSKWFAMMLAISLLLTGCTAGAREASCASPPPAVQPVSRRTAVSMPRYPLFSMPPSPDHIGIFTNYNTHLSTFSSNEHKISEENKKAQICPLFFPPPVRYNKITRNLRTE